MSRKTPNPYAQHIYIFFIFSLFFSIFLLTLYILRVPSQLYHHNKSDPIKQKKKKTTTTANDHQFTYSTNKEEYPQSKSTPMGNRKTDK